MNDINEIMSADTVKLTVDAPEQIKDKLSSEFIIEMARQLTREIERAMSVKGLAGSNVELKLAFMPETFMEHTSENVTYRRLLITDKACGTKDFWVKWTRNNGAVAFSMCDTPTEGEITFELGEDVPQKIREKEYRYLVRANTDKYHYAMGRKNVTEWRELIKRAVKRGDLERVVSEVEIADHSADVHDALSSLLSSFGVDAPAPQVQESAENTENLEFEEAMRKAKEAVFGQYSDEEVKDGAENDVPFDFSAVAEEDEASDEFSVIEDEEELEDELAEEDGVDETELADELEDELEEVEEEPEEVEEEPEEVEVEPAEEDGIDEAELEAVREELSQAKALLEELRRENAALTAENESLKQLSKTLSEEKAKIEAEMQEEHRKLREEIEARTRAEARERERLEEAARLAVIEQRRIEEERIERERREAEELRLAEEKAQREQEAARIEEERAREAERIRRETEIARGNILPEQDTQPDISDEAQRESEYTYIERRVKLLFKNLIDPNMTSRIYEIIKTTVEYYKKENVSIKIKASVPDEKTVVLDFVKIPKEENELFVNIIKVLGGSNLGITKAIVE